LPAAASRFYYSIEHTLVRCDERPRLTTPMATKTREQPVAPEADSATRERILLEAARLFRHHGYAATTLREVADASGIKAGSIYYHFASKEQILGEVMDKGILVVAAAVRERVDALPSTARARQRIAAAIEGHLWGLLHHGDFTSANIRIYGQIPTAAKNRHRLVRRAYADYWDRLLDDAVKRGELRGDSSTAVVRLFVIGALNWTVEWYNPQKGGFPDFVKQITTIVFDGILSRE
jgi:TetR/AcrR family transcriptional regulator, cholesterol catabolism regulator